MLERVSKMFDKMIAKKFYFLVSTFVVEGDFFFFFLGYSGISMMILA